MSREASSAAPISPPTPEAERWLGLRRGGDHAEADLSPCEVEEGPGGEPKA